MKCTEPVHPKVLCVEELDIFVKGPNELVVAFVPEGDEVVSFTLALGVYVTPVPTVDDAKPVPLDGNTVLPPKSGPEVLELLHNGVGELYVIGGEEVPTEAGAVLIGGVNVVSFPAAEELDDVLRASEDDSVELLVMEIEELKEV